MDKAQAVRAVRVWPTMITPFTDDNKIDYNGVLAILEWYWKKGVKGIFAVCKSSEIFEMSFKERYSLTKFILDNAPDEMLVAVSGHVSDCLDEQIEEANRLIDLRPDVFVMISNRFDVHREGGGAWMENAQRFMECLPTGQLTGMYECPYPYLRPLSPQELQWCAQRDSFVFLKDCCCDISVIRQKLAAVSDRNLNLYNANCATLLESLKCGAAGYASVMANFHPDLYEHLCKSYRDNPDQADRLQHWLTAFSLLEYQAYPQNAKYHMQLEGLPISLHTRMGKSDGLCSSQLEEIRQMHRLYQDIAGTL